VNTPSNGALSINMSNIDKEIITEMYHFEILKNMFLSETMLI
jgi:hypothetical protein